MIEAKSERRYLPTVTTALPLINLFHMDIALIGYGKMGKAIEQVALERNHNIVLKISHSNLSAFSESNLRMADVAIEFTSPDAALANVLKCLGSGLPVVSGTTGWNRQLNKAKERCVALDGAFLQTSNFSIGVNLFFEINKQLAMLMNDWPEYEVRISETHHTEKKDRPSGTAITLAEQILDKLRQKKHWSEDPENQDPAIIPIESFREEHVPGTHQVKYTSAIDDIEIIHTAHTRKGFAVGAVLAAEFLKNKKGVFSMSDVILREKLS
jgi:4-hydroxy-tetrahydrodipicolinate reductase